MADNTEAKDDTKSESSIKKVISVNSELRQKSFSHTPHDFTIKRQLQRNVETLVLCEALGDWTNRLLGESNVRGAEGFLEDVENGVVLCKILQRIGIPVEKFANPPKNDFQAKENRQKFRNACVRAKFLSIPALDADPAVGLLPSLIECAAIYEAQSKRQNVEVDMPDALTKRTAEVTISSAIKDATNGKTVAPAEYSTTTGDEQSPNISTTETSSSSSTTATQPPNAAKPSTTTATAAQAMKPRTLVTTTQQIATGARDTRSRTISKEEMVKKTRTRTASEIPSSEKDQIVNYFMISLVALILLVYMFS